MQKYLFICLAVFIGTANAATSGFSGAYDAGNWNQSLNGGRINTNKAPKRIIIRSSNNGSGANNTNFTIAALADGIVSFKWRYTTKDTRAKFDPFGWVLNGVFTKVTKNRKSGPQRGSVSFAVLAGDVFGFSARATDSIGGRGRGVVRNFSAPSAVPVPSALLLMGSGLIGVATAARRKTKKA